MNKKTQTFEMSQESYEVIYKAISQAVKHSSKTPSDIKLYSDALIELSTNVKPVSQTK